MSDEKKPTFGEALREARSHSQYTAAEITQACGISTSTMLTHYENGRTTPRLDIALSLSKLLGFSLDNLDAGVVKTMPEMLESREKLRRYREIARDQRRIERNKAALEKMHQKP